MKTVRFVVQALIQIIIFAMALNGAIYGWERFGLGADPVLKFLAIPEYGTIWSRVWWIAVGILPVAVWVTTFMKWRRRPPAIQVRTSEGETMLVHPGALVKLVRHQIDLCDAIARQRVNVYQSSNKGISVKGRISVKHLESLPQVKRELEDNIREGFRTLMGIEKIDKIVLILDFDQKSLDDTEPDHKHVETVAPKPEPPVRGGLEDDAIAFEAKDEAADGDGEDFFNTKSSSKETM